MTASDITQLTELLRKFRDEFDAKTAHSIKNASSLELAAKMEADQRRYLDQIDTTLRIVAGHRYWQ